MCSALRPAELLASCPELLNGHVHAHAYALCVMQSCHGYAAHTHHIEAETATLRLHVHTAFLKLNCATERQ